MEFKTSAPEWLNYHHLRYFHAIASEGSITRASEKLRTSQPSICTQVKQLEQALGSPLYKRSGRSITLTDFGQTVYDYAEEIFTLGRELLNTAHRAPGPRSLRLSIGLMDSFPKLLSLEVLRPALESNPPVLITCREGKMEDLLGQLVSHRLDALLTDEAPPSSTQTRTFSHLIGSGGITFCAAPSLARTLTGRFPKSLHRAPMILPTQNTSLRRELEKWFHSQNIEPRVVAEFEDAALSKIVASDGFGITAVPSMVLSEAIERYGFIPIGKTDECTTHLFLVTVERKIEHPAVSLLAKSIKGISIQKTTRGRGSSIQKKSPARPKPSSSSRSAKTPSRFQKPKR